MSGNPLRDSGGIEPKVKHGTIDAYFNHGCRCDECREAGSRYMKDRRARAAGYAPRRSEDA